MKIKCISDRINSEQLLKIYGDAKKREDLHVSKGKEYLVFGIHFEMDSEFFRGVFYQIEDDYGNLSFATSILFEITQPMVSNYWVTKQVGKYSLSIAHPSFFQEYFHEDLSEGVPEVVNEFKRVKEILEAEEY